MVTTTDKIRSILSVVTDPEIPVLTIEDMGIIRDIEIEDSKIKVIITPTYSGCPAMDMIKVNILSALEDAGYYYAEVDFVIDPPWTTDWITEDGKRKLREYGIAPPVGSVDKNSIILENITVACPQCNSNDTSIISQFGSTPCKSLYKCNSCLEPFDYFKCH